MFCDAESGYIWNNNMLYTGADTDVVEDDEYHALNIIMTLINDLLDEGWCVYIDTWYTHPLNYVTNYVKDKLM